MTDVRWCIVGFPRRVMVGATDTDIVRDCSTKAYDRETGRKYASNLLDIPHFDRFVFMDGLNREVLLSDDNGGLEINSRGMINMLFGLATMRPEPKFVLPHDLRRFFEKHTSSLANAERWADNVLPYLLKGTGMDMVPVGTKRRYSIRC